MIHCDILIIDDDIDDIKLLTDIFNNRGIERIHYVYSAKEAFMYLQEVFPFCIPKAIITDFFLPGTTAVEFLTEFKAMEEYKHVAVVVLSTLKSEVQNDKLKELDVV